MGREETSSSTTRGSVSEGSGDANSGAVSAASGVHRNRVKRGSGFLVQIFRGAVPAANGVSEETRRRKRCGGEFETLVTDGPHMSRPIELEYTTDWDGTRGTIVVEDAWLGE